MGQEAEFKPEQIAEVYPKVAQNIADALGREPEELKLKSRLIGDLGAESIDTLDIVFRLERAFKIKIPRGKILAQARGNLTEQEFEEKGYVTEAGRRRLQQYLSEVPSDQFPASMKVADLPTLFTVETFCKLVLRAQRAEA
jgi:acyl carrier protein